MQAVSYSNIRSNLKTYCDKVINDSEPIIITRKNERNVVLISLEEYNNLVENNYIMSDKKYYDRLIESKNQIEKGMVVKKTSQELEDMLNE